MHDENLPSLRCWIVGADHLCRLHQLIEVGSFSYQRRTEVEESHRVRAIPKVYGILTGQTAIEQAVDHRSPHPAEMLPQFALVPVVRYAELLTTVEND